ncbi:MAG: tetratricopeptide repeat protein [Bacteroidota bacterium]
MQQNLKNQLFRHIEEGKALYESRDYEPAYEYLSRAIYLIEEAKGEQWIEPDELSQLYLLRGSALMYDDEARAFEDPDIFHQILEDFEQAIDAQPHQPLYYLVRGRMYLNSKFGRYSREAKADFSQVLSLDPTNISAHKFMGQVLSKEEAYDRAIYYFSKVLEQSDDTETYLLRGVSHFRNRPPNFEAAVADFGRAQELLPRLQELYIWRSQCFQEMGQIESAIQEYDRLIDLVPHKAGHYIDRGVIRSAIDPEGAVQDYNRALELEPHPLAYNNRAAHHRAAGNYEAAIADANAALAVDGKYSIAYATLAEIYADQGNRESFYHFLRLAIDHYYEDIVEVMMEPAFAPYQQEERFQEVIGRR